MNQLLSAFNHRVGASGRMSTLLACVFVFALVAASWQPAAVQAAVGALVQIDAPQQVAAGQPILVTVSLQTDGAVGGWQAALQFDGTAAHFAGTEQAAQDTQAVVSAVETASGVTLGTFSCAGARCGNLADEQVLPQQTLRIIPDRPGVLEIGAGPVIVVDAQGNVIPAQMATPTIVVQVGANGAGPLHKAPQAPVLTSSPQAPVDRPSTNEAGNKPMRAATITDAALAWTLAQEQGTACGAAGPAPHDVDGDGCLTIADLQIVAARMQPAAAQAPSDAAQAVVAGATFVVNTTGDGDDVQQGDGVCQTTDNTCSLRAALVEANLQTGSNTINFNIPGTTVHTIQLTQPLPTINDLSGPTTIDGYSQPGAVPNTDSLVSNAQIKVQIAGAGTTGFEALGITSPNNVVRGLAFFNLHRVITLYGTNATGTIIVGNFIGTDTTGTAASGGYVSGAHGIMLQRGAANNRIGGTALADRNIISGNGQHGVAMYDGGTSANIVVNNIFGLSPGGDRRVPNGRNGVDINYGASANIVGGTGTNERNVVSGNDLEGIELSHYTATAQNRVIGNFVGTDPSGTQVSAITANAHYGVHIEDNASNNVVANNVVGGNAGGGIRIAGELSRGNQLSNNRVGAAPNGAPIPNGVFGIEITDNANQNRIGPNNTIAHNVVGIRITADGSDRNTITQNAIYGNARLGIDLWPVGINANDQYTHDGPNERLNFPVLNNATRRRITGTACPGCRVEVFVADRGGGAYGQGRQFIGATTANSSGTFSLRLNNLPNGTPLTATATDADGNTSEFARNIVVGSTLVQLYIPQIVR